MIIITTTLYIPSYLCIELKLKKMKIKNLFLILYSFSLIVSTTTAQEAYTVKNFKMSVAGTSTLHDWESEVTQVDASASLELAGAQLTGISKLKVTIPAKGIVSTKGKIMDNKTYDALKADKHPKITFTLAKAAISSSKVQASGQLTIAGATKTVSLNAESKADSNGNITFTGSYPIKMTDYGMEPPTAMMGAIKTGDEVTVKFQLTLAPNGAGIGAR